jgi:ribosomal protein L40E
MRKTYWPTGIVLGTILGFATYASTENMARGILAGIGVSAVGIVVILGIEKALDKGIDAGAAAIKGAIDKRKNRDEHAPPASAEVLIVSEQSGEATPLAEPGINPNMSFCNKCGNKFSDTAKFCNKCGAARSN